MSQFFLIFKRNKAYYEKAECKPTLFTANQSLHTSEEPDIPKPFNHVKGIHSLKLRRVRQEEPKKSFQGDKPATGLRVPPK